MPDTALSPSEGKCLFLPSKSARARWCPEDDGVRFRGRAWLRVGRDETVQVGPLMALGRGELKAFEASVCLPLNGDGLKAGLPMLSWIDSHGTPRCVASPISGRVLDVNWDLPERMARSVRAPLGRSWLARLQPELNPRELSACRPREVWVLAQAGMTLRWQDRLARLGCRVRRIEEPAELFSDLKSGAQRVVMVGEPMLIEALERRRQAAADQPARVLLCALDPAGLSDASLERMGVDGCLRTASSSRLWLRTIDELFAVEGCRMAPMRSGAQAEWRQMISIENVRGRVAAVLMERQTVREHPGLIPGLIRQFSGHGFIPVVGSGPATIDRQAVVSALERTDALVVLRNLDSGRCPGALTTRRFSAGWNLVQAQERLVDAIVQPTPPDPPGWQFDQRTDASLAGHVAACLFEL